MSVKEAAIEMIRRLPNDVTTKELAYHLYIRAMIEERLQQADAGEAITHEEFVKRMERWLVAGPES